MPAGTRAHRGDRLQRWLAGWLTVLLAVAPFAPFLPVNLVAVRAAAPEALVADDDTQDQQPDTGLRPTQPATLGILSRLSLLETTLGLPPVKPPLLRPSAERPALALRATAAFSGEPRDIFHSGSVGTARTPTGPPS